MGRYLSGLAGLVLIMMLCTACALEDVSAPAPQDQPPAVQEEVGGIVETVLPAVEEEEQTAPETAEAAPAGELQENQVLESISLPEPYNLDVSVEAIDLKQPQNAAYLEALMNYNPEASKEDETFHLGNGAVITEHNNSIFLINADGTETMLLEGVEEIGESIQSYNVKYLYGDHQFIYVVGGWEWHWHCGLYDVETRQDHPFMAAGSVVLTLQDNTLYSIADFIYGTYTGEFNLSKTDLTTYQTTLLLENIPESLLELASDYGLSPDGQIFALRTFDERLYLFSTEYQEQLLVYDLPDFCADNYGLRFISSRELLVLCSSSSHYEDESVQALLIHW